MRQCFNLTGKTFSINAMYGPKKFKTSDARNWEYDILNQLRSADNASKFQQLRDSFDIKKHSYFVSITVIYPKTKFYTKAGGISSMTQDVSNYEKPLIDLFFLPKYFDNIGLYGCKNLNVDDKYITQMKSCKKPGEDYSIQVEVEIINQPL